MAKLTKAQSGLYYTYVWRNASGMPFYVGKGMGRRAYEVRESRRSKDFVEVHKAGGCSVELVDFFIHETQAHAHEMELIEKFGRRDIGSGTLINKTDGGDGMSGHVHSLETRAKMSKAQVGNKKAIGNKNALGYRHPDDARERISAGLRGRKHSAEHRQKNSLRRRLDEPASGYKGVNFHKLYGKWVARITIGGVRKHLGYFPEEQEAAKAYDSAAIEAWGVGNCYINLGKDFSV